MTKKSSSNLEANLISFTPASPISSNESKTKTKTKAETPAHWTTATAGTTPGGGGFRNPWPSFRVTGLGDMVSGMSHAVKNYPKIPGDIEKQVGLRVPTWTTATKEGSEDLDSDSWTRIKSTWLGHACFLVELPRPAPSYSRGARILFDPVWSDRCSPSQWIGPKRYTPPPCKLSDLPSIDAVVISHNHYDHLDVATISELARRPAPYAPHFFAPLGNKKWFLDLGVQEERVHEMDWWGGGKMDVKVPASEEGSEELPLSFKITATPAQHFTGRGLTDRFKTLWASWVVETTDDGSSAPGARGPVTVFFGGDTGYRSVPPGAKEDDTSLPTCPAFKEIGTKFGGFDFAMIPIGAYLPRFFMSPIHCSPWDSVQLFKDIRAKKALGMHWGTWTLTTEAPTDPPAQLRQECEKAGIAEEQFGVCEIGETREF